MGITFLLTMDVDRPVLETSIAGHIRAPVQHLKVMALSDGTVALTILGYVGPDGKLLNIETWRPHGGKAYDSSRLRPVSYRTS
jgi:hypothetical protein